MDKSNNLVRVLKYVVIILFQNWLVIFDQSASLMVKGDKWAHLSACDHTYSCFLTGKFTLIHFPI